MFWLLANHHLRFVNWVIIEFNIKFIRSSSPTKMNKLFLYIIPILFFACKEYSIEQTMRIFLFLFLAILFSGCKETSIETHFVGEKITLIFEGPQSSESHKVNPFTDYRMTVKFVNGKSTFEIPGFYAADGKASETSSNSGNKWMVRFRPETSGIWSYTVNFKSGAGIAVNPDVMGKSVGADGLEGKFEVLDGDESGWQAKGRLITNSRYRQYSTSGEYYLKGGPDSPENFLAFAEFDDTYRYEENNRTGEARIDSTLHTYSPHIKDWSEGDPTWKGTKGKGIIGALNYLASKKMNVVYMLTMNIQGDGKDVWPYISPNEIVRFDCSKLDQWEVVFDHMDNLGIMQHFVLQETENELFLDDGNTGFNRKLYLRELIARFGHHPGVTWNIGEENGPADFSPEGQTTEQQLAMINYLKESDPYENFVVVHTHADGHLRNELMTKLLGKKNLDGVSLQIGSPQKVNEETKYWIDNSGSSGKQWVVNLDEIGPYWSGIHPDDWPNNNQDSLFHQALWGNLLAGGAGVEWYFGYKAPNNDLNCENWRSRDRVWDVTQHALNFFHDHLPFWEMESRVDLTENSSGFCFAKEGEIYVVYVPKEKIQTLNVEGNYKVEWFDPFNGGALQSATFDNLGPLRLEAPDKNHDWVALVKKD